MGDIIIKSENVGLVMQDAPKAYQENSVSNTRCTEAGNILLEQIRSTGMTDALDQAAAEYIGKARATVKKMQEKRSPVTKLFDEMRSAYTALENSIDPTKAGTVPYELQQLRNRYAAKKKEEEDRRRRELMARQQAEQAKTKYRADVTDYYQKYYNGLLINHINDITTVFSNATLETIDKAEADIRTYSPRCEIPPQPAVMRPVNISLDELNDIADECLTAAKKDYMEKCDKEVSAARQRYLSMLPGKKQELERAAKASAEEAERIKAEVAKRDAEEAQRLAEQRRAEMERAEMERKTQAQAESLNGLFGQSQAAAPAYTPAITAKMKLVPLTQEAFPEIFALWWSHEGMSLSVEELSKTFKKMITYCEKLANDKTNPVVIKSEFIDYQQEVKAK